MPTPHILFELLENAGYINGDVVNRSRVQRATLTDVIDLSTQSAELTSTEQIPRNRSAFAHTASISLGGGRYPCPALGCRVKHVDELSQFAALYSDKVYIQNFLSDFHEFTSSTIEDLPLYQVMLEKDLEVLLRLRPLIEAEKVIPITNIDSWCSKCFGVRVEAIDGFAPEIMDGLALAGHQLRERFLSESKVTIERFGKNYRVAVRASEDLLEHGFHATTFSEMPERMREMPEVLRLMARGRKVPLTRKQVERLDIHKDETAEILQNVLFELSISQSFGTSLLTERPIHVKIFQKLTESTQQEQRNALIKKHLTTLVPFLDGLDAQQLLKIRESEADSFLLFRQALNRVIDEASSKDDDFTERKARELYGDELEPSLARLDLKLRSAQRGFMKTTGRKVTALAGAITFGLFSGMIPASLGAAAKVLGLTKILSDLGESALQAQGDEDTIRSDEMYFLWKVRQRSTRR